MNKIFNNKNQKNIRQSLRKKMPKGEVVLWDKLKNSKTGYKFRRQQGIDNYVVDFYCPKLKLAIEIDGRTHDYKDSINNDKDRQNHLEKLGIVIKRFDSSDALKDLDYVIESIINICKKLDNN